MDSRRGRQICWGVVVTALLALLLLVFYSHNNDKSVLKAMLTQLQQQPVPASHLPTAPAITCPTVKEEKETNPIPTDSKLDAMSVADLSDLFHGYTSSTQALCSRVLRMGNIGDGGWDVCDDPKYKPDQANCLVYSLGINNEWSYDDAVEKYGCEVHSFDPSMHKVNDHIRGKKIHFHRIGIAGKDYNMKTGQGKWALYTLGSLRKMNGHEPAKRRVDIVKMDVEGSEFPSLITALSEGSLLDARQLSFEIHIGSSNGDPIRNKVLSMLKIMRGLWDQGFRIYYTTRNSVRGNLYMSKAHGVQRTACTEVNMVNIKYRR